MPELPEVETVARDLRAIVLGARLTGAAVAWERTVRGIDPAALGAAVAGRSKIGRAHV